MNLEDRSEQSVISGFIFFYQLWSGSSLVNFVKEGLSVLIWRLRMHFMLETVDVKSYNNDWLAWFWLLLQIPLPIFSYQKPSLPPNIITWKVWNLYVYSSRNWLIYPVTVILDLSWIPYPIVNIAVWPFADVTIAFVIQLELFNTRGTIVCNTTFLLWTLVFLTQ